MALHQGEEDVTRNPNPSEKKATTTKQQWRFTWETLAHTPTLRLYLFRYPGSTDPLPRCSHLLASLCLAESLLLVSFLDLEAPDPASAEAAARQVVLRVPVPRVLIDPGCPVNCVTKNDHIEIKLALIVPVDHPLVKEFRGALDLDRDVIGSSDHDQVLLSMNDDLKSISSGGVDFYCNTCSTKLTKQPLSCIVEMPSSNWRDVADNWFGNCCCSFGEPATFQMMWSGSSFFVKTAHRLLGHTLLRKAQKLQLMAGFGCLSAIFLLAFLLVGFMIYSGNILWKESL